MHEADVKPAFNCVALDAQKVVKSPERALISQAGSPRLHGGDLMVVGLLEGRAGDGLLAIAPAV